MTRKPYEHSTNFSNSVDFDSISHDIRCLPSKKKKDSRKNNVSRHNLGYPINTADRID